MTPQEQAKSLTDKIIGNLCRITKRPDEWLPHIVYVEEEGDYPVYNRYELIDYNPDGSCTLYNPRTDSRENDFHLSAINIDWLVTVWNRYVELSIVQGTWADHAIGILMEHTVANEMTIREFVENHWQNLLLDDDNIKAFKGWMAGNKPASPQFYAFVWSCNYLDRNVPDEALIEAWKNGPSRSKIDEDDEQLYEVEKLTPDELAERINDEGFAFAEDYVRFIKQEE